MDTPQCCHRSVVDADDGHLAKLQNKRTRGGGERRERERERGVVRGEREKEREGR